MRLRVGGVRREKAVRTIGCDTKCFGKVQAVRVPETREWMKTIAPYFHVPCGAWCAEPAAHECRAKK